MKSGKMKIKKRLSALLLTLVLCCGAAAPAYAAQVPDLSRTGSISAAMTYDGKAVGGGSLTLYKVGEIAQNDGNYSFVLTQDYQDSSVSLSDISDPDLAKSLAEYAAGHQRTGITVDIGEDGQVKAQNLELGLYLVIQSEAAEGFEAVAPFLVSVPMYENGVYVYDVDAQPKLGTLTRAQEESEEESETTSETTTPDTTTTTTDTHLPQTGQLNWPIPVLTIAGLLLILAGLGLRGAKQRKNHGA